MYAGTGCYSLADAARLIRAPARSVRRWVCGYDYSVTKNNARQDHHSEPLWQTEYPDDAFDEKVLGFRDLLELRVVREFVNHGVPLLIVRRCLETAQQIYGDPYPMTTHRFATDGKTVFVQVVKGGVEKELLDLRKRQIVFSDIIKPSLFSGIEYQGDFARRWYPEGRNRRNIVVDPQQQFGKPIVDGVGVPTEALYSNFVAEGGDRAAIGVVAKIFEMPVGKVEAAVHFEENLRLAA